MTPFEKRITARPEDIDELGHVNNAAWVRWIQDMATAHWHAVAPADHVDAYVWVVTRHEIDYLRAVRPGRDGDRPHLGRASRPRAPASTATSSSSATTASRGCGRKTTWAILDKATRPAAARAAGSGGAVSRNSSLQGP